jgi:hypothetical protein
LNSKRIYEYEHVSLHIPRKYHELIKPFLNQDFDVSVAAEKDIIVITLTPQKPVQHAESPSYKTALEARPETILLNYLGQLTIMIFDTLKK